MDEIQQNSILLFDAALLFEKNQHSCLLLVELNNQIVIGCQ